MTVKAYAKRVLNPIIDRIEFSRLPAAAKQVARADGAGLHGSDPGAAAAIAAALDWIGRAQDCSRSADGGVARHYSLTTGWGSSYPETTGYIVPTMLDQAERRRDDALRQRARRMLDWLVSIQFPEGGFRGGVIDQGSPVPVTFNTGQILLGLAAGTAVFGDRYRPAMRRAADWLASTLDSDGCWRKYRTPFASQDDKSYETHVSWGLFEAARVDSNKTWGEAGIRQVRWALTKQHANGWMASCCLEDPSNPLTHTLGYALRGILECHRYSGEAAFLDAARHLAEGLLAAQHADGRLPGQLGPDWSAGAPWVCLTGLVQIAHCWLLLYQETGERHFRDAGFAGNAFARRTVAYDGPDDLRGGVKGSFPVDGDYGRFQYLNWATKFFIDSNQAEASVRAVENGQDHAHLSQSAE
jgi:hypothetical protein